MQAAFGNLDIGQIGVVLAGRLIVKKREMIPGRFRTELKKGILNIHAVHSLEVRKAAIFSSRKKLQDREIMEYDPTGFTSRK